jgi:arylsulfatase A-like enzyme
MFAPDIFGQQTLTLFLASLGDTASRALATPSFVALAFASGMVSVCALARAATGGGVRARALSRTATLAIIVGFTAGAITAARHIGANDYWALGLRYLTLVSLATHITASLATSLGTAAAVIVVMATAGRQLGRSRITKATRDALIVGAAPALMVFVIAGNWINQHWLPGFLTIASLIGNLLWILTCGALAWPLGRVTLSMLRRAPGSIGAVYDRGRPSAIATILAATTFGLYAASAADRMFRASAPNIVMISIDTLRADHLGSYGYDRPTPNLDRVAADGTLFEQAIVQAPWTLPSHMSMLTGLYSRRHGVIHLTDRLGESQVMLTEILRNAGYVTAAFVDGGYLSLSFGYQGFDTFDDGPGTSEKQPVENIVRKALRWLASTRGRPFFLFLHTYQVHCPYDPLPRHDVYSDPDYRGPVQVAGNCGGYYDALRQRLTLEPADFAYIVAKYDGELHYVDEELGELFALLRTPRFADRTVIVVTSDHGENFDDHPRFPVGHSSLHDEVVRVPLLIAGPGIPAGQRIREQVESIDIMPTLLDLIGLRPPAPVDGRSLAPLMADGTFDGTLAFSENYWRVFDTVNERWISTDAVMIRTDDWKLIRRAPDNHYAPGMHRLFNLENDPHERHDLFEAQPEKAAPLAATLDAWNQEQAAHLMTSDAGEHATDDALEDRLRALGYVR